MVVVDIMEDWTPYFTHSYDPLMAGSIDGTDEIPHDHGVVRAMKAKYRPNKGVKGDPQCTLFVSRLNYGTSVQVLHQEFSQYGDIRNIRLVRDLVTGYSKGYAFIEYQEEKDARIAKKHANNKEIDDKEILVEIECERTLKGWIPRRFGGGLGGRKESGQLRFGGIDRPFRQPIVVNQIGRKNVRHREKLFGNCGRNKYSSYGNRDRDGYRDKPR